MSAYRFALVGSGWRAAFYARIAKKMPDMFQLAGTWVHSCEKSWEWQRQYGGAIASQPEDLLKEQPDFLVVALNKQYAFPYIMVLLKTDIPLLLETPPAVQPQQLMKLWDAAKNRAAPVLVAEQYPDQPYFKAWKRVVDMGQIGAVSDLSISMVHGYHAMALIRAFLGVHGENVRITGSQYHFSVRKTGDRRGLILQGELHEPPRDRAALVFDSGKTAFYDFCGEQYHSAIRFSHFGVQGQQGEIFDNQLLCLNERGYPVAET
ncbi:MAG: Gfo/Idh/MocA family oxidoreductase, partial [Clostridia bacterium]|nr:Gfo/Idh/MocA family oxidoreductase [Clostridia bacterium]